MILRHVDQRAVGIGQLNRAVRAFLQQRQPRGALGIERDRLRRQLDIGLGNHVAIGFEGFDIGHAKADVIHARLLDAGAVERRIFHGTIAMVMRPSVR
jgi:hypothetical protein